LSMLIEGIDLQKRRIRQPLSRPVRRGDRDACDGQRGGSE
jgi:hypothetical protein